MTKNRLYKEFKLCEVVKGFSYMQLELENAPNWIVKLFERAKSDFINNKFTYDGATFVPERSKHTIFEVAAFIHDWLNSMGYISYASDTLMFEIMKELKYKWWHFVLRYTLTRLTFINIIKHKIKGTYKGKMPIQLILQ